MKEDGIMYCGGNVKMDQNKLKYLKKIIFYSNKKK